MLIILKLSQVEEVRSYFNHEQHLSFLNQTGDWVPPELKLVKHSSQNPILINELIQNGSFVDGLSFWNIAGDVDYRQTPNQTSEFLSNQHIQLHSSFDKPSSISQDIPAHQGKFLHFWLKVDTQEQVDFILEQTFSVYQSEQLLYQWQPENTQTLSTSWNHIFLLLPATEKPTNLKFEVQSISNVVKSTTFNLADVTTSAAAISISDPISVTSNEEDVGACLKNLSMIVPTNCFRLPGNIEFIDSKISKLEIIATDQAGLERKQFVWLLEDMSPPVKPEIFDVQRENNLQLSLRFKQDNLAQEPYFLELGFSSERAGTYTWQSSLLLNWLKFPNLQSDQVHIYNSSNPQIKLKESYPADSKWLKIRSLDIAGNYSAESEAVAID